MIEVIYSRRELFVGPGEIPKSKQPAQRTSCLFFKLDIFLELCVL